MPAISVKVSVKKVITAMEAKIAENLKRIKLAKEAQKKKEEAQEKHEAFVRANAAKIALKAGVKPELCTGDIRWGEHSGKFKVELTYYLHKEDAALLLKPEVEDDDISRTPIGALEEQNAELGNAVRLLKMTDDEFVNTSTYKSVAKYL